MAIREVAQTTIRTIACALLLIAHAAHGSAAESQKSHEEVTLLDEVVVYGTDGKLITGMQAESELDATAIAAYGADTIGDLLSQVAPDVNNTQDGPIILINGKPANGIRSVNDLPPEAVANIQVLPPQAATALGYSPTRRVINVVLKTHFRQGIGNATARKATAGGGFQANGNVSLVEVGNNGFRNLSLRASRTEPLLEADRGIISDPGIVPYDLVGNVQSWPVPGAEIDPALSAQAGQPVTVLGIPAGLTDPTLADLLPGANSANSSDMGRYRTLIADQYNYGINGNFSRPLPRRMAMNINFNADHSEIVSKTGATPVLLQLPASSPFSPFSRDVGIARYLGDPLRQHQGPTTANFNGNLNGQLRKWNWSLDSSHSWRSSTTNSDRFVDTTALQDAIDAGAFNPFEAIPDDLLGATLRDRARARSYNGSAQLQAMGSPFTLPTGKANASVRLQWQENRQWSSTTGTTNYVAHSNQQTALAFGSLQLPLLGNAEARDGSSLGGEISGTAHRVTASGTLLDYGYGLNWRRGTRLTLRLNLTREQMAPGVDSLSNPIVVVDGYRTYDFIREETVLVRYITGGNPDLGVGSRNLWRFGGTYKPFASVDLTLNAEYLRTVSHNGVSALPPVSEDVQEAFPDRYIRDAAGTLIEIDARPVTFARSETEVLRWGANFRRGFGVPKTPSTPPAGGPRIVFYDDASDLSGAGWRVMGNFTHTWQISSTRRVRDGLPEVDLLSGGVAGFSAQPRHAVQGRVGIARNGSGFQLNASWRSDSRMTAGTADAPDNLTFHPFLRLDASAFFSMGDIFPGNAVARGMRITLGIDNLFDTPQRVTDDNGQTPLRYQRYLLDALGRTVALSLRKMF